jgi:uncharacterized protein YoxC
MDAFEILVVILSVTLAIFLVTAIVLSIALIKFMQKVDRIADQAETTAQNIAEASNTMKQFAGPAAIAQMVAKFIRR